MTSNHDVPVCENNATVPGELVDNLGWQYIVKTFLYPCIAGEFAFFCPMQRRDLLPHLDLASNHYSA
jgi:hypothetical protein